MRSFVDILTFMSIQVALFQRCLFQTQTSKGRKKSTWRRHNFVQQSGKFCMNVQEPLLNVLVDELVRNVHKVGWGW